VREWETTEYKVEKGSRRRQGYGVPGRSRLRPATAGLRRAKEVSGTCLSLVPDSWGTFPSAMNNDSSTGAELSWVGK
jgi:hypothetical protein